MNRCGVEGCDKPELRATGLCTMHYTRMQRHGNLIGLKPHDPPDVRFDRKVNKTDAGCWLWTAYRAPAGYGIFIPLAGGGRVWAHRYAYARVNGPIPAGMHVLHSCDTPACVNPSHLSLGTHADNMADKARKGRASKWGRDLLTCAQGHPWTPENTRRSVTPKGYWRRNCRSCQKLRDAKRNAA